MENDEEAAALPKYAWIIYADRKPPKSDLYLVSNGDVIRAAVFFPEDEDWTFDDAEPVPAEWGLSHWCHLPPIPPITGEDKKPKTHFTEELRDIVSEANDLNGQIESHANADRKLRKELIALVARLAEVAEEQARFDKQTKESKQ